MMREESKQKGRRERSVGRRTVEFGGRRKKDVEKASMVRTTLEFGVTSWLPWRSFTHF